MQAAAKDSYRFLPYMPAVSLGILAALVMAISRSPVGAVDGKTSYQGRRDICWSNEAVAKTSTEQIF